MDVNHKSLLKNFVKAVSNYLFKLFYRANINEFNKQAFYNRFSKFDNKPLINLINRALNIQLHNPVVNGGNNLPL